MLARWAKMLKYLAFLLFFNCCLNPHVLVSFLQLNFRSSSRIIFECFGPSYPHPHYPKRSKKAVHHPQLIKICERNYVARKLLRIIWPIFHFLFNNFPVFSVVVFLISSQFQLIFSPKTQLTFYWCITLLLGYLWYL